MDIVQNVAKIAKNKGLTLTELERLCGFSKSSIRKWSENFPNINKIILVAQVLEVSLDKLVFDKNDIAELTELERQLLDNYNSVDEFGKTMIQERASTLAELQAAKKQTVKTPLKQHLKQSETKAEYIYLPYPDSPASAGTGEYLDSDAVEELQVPATNLTKRADYALSVHGDSMEPSYHDGDIVLVSKSDVLSIGDIGIFVVNGEGYIKEYGGDRLISINNKYGDIVFNENDRCECQGKVIGKL